MKSNVSSETEKQNTQAGGFLVAVAFIYMLSVLAAGLGMVFIAYQTGV